MAQAAGQADWSAFDTLVSQARTEMMMQPDIALRAAQHAEAIAANHKEGPQNREAIATALCLEAEALNRTNHNAGNGVRAGAGPGA